MIEKKRCDWCGTLPIYVDYHDNIWGKPLHDDKTLFEMLILDCMQAGLSWLTILRKQENYRLALDDYDLLKISNYDDNKINELLNNPGIIRNRLKIEAIINNAKAFLRVQEQFGSFDKMIWQYVDYKPIINHFEKQEELPARTPLSDQISKDLKKLGFKFVGSTIVYAFMQAIGMVNDHLTCCYLYEQINELK